MYNVFDKYFIRYIIPIFLFCTIQSNPVFSQYQLHYEQFTTTDGLSENVVFCLLQDKNGFIWAGTYHGLNRYDGYSFKNYYSDNDDSTSLSGNIIRCMAEGDNGLLWIGTGRGLNCLDPESGRCTRFPFPGREMDYEIIGLHFISTDSLLVRFQNDEYYLFLYKKKQWVNPYKLTFSKTRKFINKYKLGFNSIQFKDNNGNSFSGIGKKYLEICDNHDKVIAKLNSEYFSSMLSPEFFDIEEAASGDVWIGTNNGLLCYDALTQDITYVELIGNSRSMAPRKEIRSLLIDKSGNLWIGTFGDGILKCHIRKSPFSSISMEEITSGDYQRMITALYKWPDSTLVAEISFQNLSIIQDRKVSKHINGRELSLERICEVTTGKSIEKFSAIQREIARNLYKSGSLRANRFRLFGEDAIVVVSPTFTIHKLDTFYKNSHYTTNYFDDGVYFWVPTYKGLLRINKETLRKKTYLHSISDPFSISENSITCVIGDSVNNLWIGTKGGGLNYFDRKRGRVYHYNTEDGLPDNVIYFMLSDKKGNLWLSTNNGLSRFNIADKTFHNFSIRDGLINSEFNRNGGVIMDNGTMYFAGTNGIDYFKPEDIISDTVRPGIYFSSVIVNGKEVGYNSRHEYRYYQNNFRFYFNANDFHFPQLIYYRYRLNGIIDEWERLQGINYVSFNVLPPGDYRLEVQSSYNNLLWSNSAIYEFNINEAWWQVWWFSILIFLTIITLLYWLYNYRIQQIRKLVTLRTQISQDLHDEVGATLTSISFLSEVADNQVSEKNSSSKKTIQKIGEYSREMIGEMNDIVWAINPANDKFKKINDRILNYASPLLSSKGIEFDFYEDAHLNDVSLNMQQRKNLYLVFKEAVNNAAKHADCTTVRVTVKRKNNDIWLSVTDNGKGFTDSAIVQGNGLANLKYRAQEVKASLKIHSRQGKGTTIIFSMPITHNT